MKISLVILCVTISALFLAIISQVSNAGELLEPEFLNVVYGLDASGKLVDLERQPASVKTKKVALGFGGAKQTASISGSTSPVQFSAGVSYTFVVKLPAGSDPGKFQLYKFLSSQDHREVLLGQVGYVSKSTGMGTVSFDTAPYGSSYKLVIGGSLEPGEYGFSSSDSQTVFCFELK